MFYSKATQQSKGCLQVLPVHDGGAPSLGQCSVQILLCSVVHLRTLTIVEMTIN